MSNTLKQLDSELTQQLMNSVMAFAEDHKEERILQRVVDSAIELTGAKRGFLATVEEQTRFDHEEMTGEDYDSAFRIPYRDEEEIVVHVARTDQKENIPEPREEISISLLKKSIQSEQPELASNIKQDEQIGHQPSIMNLDLASVISSPLMAEDQSIGAIYLDNPEEEGFFSSQELSALFFLASHAAVFIHNKKLHTESIRDRLSGLFSNNYFQQRLQEEVKKAVRLNQPLSLLMTDMDDFKRINDIMGHAAGDQLIEEVGFLLQKELRGYDITARTEPVAGRYGGDEFEILLIDTDAEEAKQIAERILETMRDHTFTIDDQTVDVELSIGVASLPEDGKTTTELVEAADEAMMKAKRKGGNQYFAFEEEGSRDLRDKKEWGKKSMMEETYVSRDRMLVLSLLSEVTQAGLELNEMLNVTLKMVVEVTNARSGYVITEDESGNLNTKAQFFSGENDWEPPENGAEEMVSKNIVRKALKKGKGLLIEDASDNNDIHSSTIDELDLRSVLVVPVRAGDRQLGVIYLENSAVASRFDEEDLSLVNALSQEISSPLEAAKAHEEKVSELEKMRRRFEDVQEDLQTQYSYENIVGSSNAIQEVCQTLDKITPTNLNVMIEGDTGTGKELAARSIHYNGPRKDHPFLAVNCARFSKTLLESELFGHMKGSFTGADKNRAGLFEQADEGTLFLDEISEMSPDMQARLLRVLETGEVRRIGDDRTRSVDVRIICATNQPMREMIQAGKFREDLYYRLADATVRMPPLKDRKEDIPELVDYFLAELAEEKGLPKKEVEDEVIMKFMNRDWPGNVRQLRSKVRQLAMFSGDREKITTEDLFQTSSRSTQKESGSEKGATAEPADQDPDPEQVKTIEEMEKEEIRKALEKSDGNKKKAAELLEIHYTTLYRKIKDYDLEQVTQ